MSRNALTRIINEFGMTTTQVMSKMGLKPLPNTWHGLSKSFVTGSITLQRIRRVADVLGISPGALIDLVEAEIAMEQEGAEYRLSDIEVLERMKARDPALAFAYYSILRERGLTTKEVDEWANQHL